MPTEPSYDPSLMSEEEREDLEKIFPDRIPHEVRTFILRWNPDISSTKLEDLQHAARKFPDGFGSDWSVYDWQHARKGDRFYMERVGDPDHTGIVFAGEFTSDPYADEDWRQGSHAARRYCDYSCYGFRKDMEPVIPLSRLQEAIPEVEWTHGHSGELLNPETAWKLDQLWNAIS